MDVFLQKWGCFVGWVLYVSFWQLKYFWRQSVLSVLGIAVGVLVLMVILSFSQGIQEHFVESILTLYPHLTLERGVDLLIEEDLLPLIEEVEGVLGVAPYLFFPGLITHNRNTYTVAFKGVIWEKEEALFGLSSKLDQGDWRDLSVHPGILLGGELSRRLQARIGDTVQILTSKGLYSLPVQGIFFTGYLSHDANLVLLPLPLAQEFLEVQGIGGYGVLVEDFYAISQYILPLQQKTNLWVRPWYESQKGLFISLSLQRGVMIWISGFTFLVASFGVANIFLLRAFYQMRTVGILRSLGALPYHIVSGLVLQGLICGLMGAVLGLLSAFFLVQYLSRYPIHMPEIYYVQNLPISWDSQGVILALLVAVLSSGLAAVYPAWRLSIQEPSEVIKHGTR